VSDATNNLARAEGDYVNAVYEYHKAIAAARVRGRPPTALKRIDHVTSCQVDSGARDCRRRRTAALRPDGRQEGRRATEGPARVSGHRDLVAAVTAQRQGRGGDQVDVSADITGRITAIGVKEATW
jgi:hypothetical protein